MPTPHDVAKHKAFKDFREAHPQIKYDRSNKEHERFIDKQIQAHEHIMDQNARARRYGEKFR